MNLLDLLLLVMMAGAGLAGYRLGFVTRAASWVGALGGLVLSAWTARAAVGLVDPQSAATRMIVTIMAVFATMGIGSALGEAVGLRARRALHRTPLRPFDHAAGAFAGVAGILVAVWFLAPAAADVPGGVAQQVRGSTVVTWVRDVAPTPPDAVRSLRQLIDRTGFPEVFSDFGRAPETGPPPSQIPVPQEVVQRVVASTVNVEAQGCGLRYEGSGFAAAENTIVTNAHVVAGADHVQVRRPDGAVLDATVVVFNDNRDLAILDVPGLGEAPLDLATATEGADGAAVGYPGGQNTPRTEPVGIRERRLAVGRDIYHEDVVEREILVMAASLIQGDSGGPVFDVDGNVVGATFAVAADRSSTAYALDVTEIQAALDAPRQPGATGRCQ